MEWHTRQVLEKMPGNWSAYRDESWQGAAPGTHGMQPRVLHLLRGLGLDPGQVPASNVVFVRTRDEQKIDGFNDFADACWPRHERP